MTTLGEEMRRRQRELEEKTKARQQATRKAIREALIARGHTLDGHVWIDGCFVEWTVKREERTGYAHGRWTGKLRVIVGSYGNKRQFPEPKKGFDIAKIVDEIEARLGYEQEKKARREAGADAKERSAAELAALGKRVGVPAETHGSWYGSPLFMNPDPHVDPDGDPMIKVELTTSLSVPRAEELCRMVLRWNAEDEYDEDKPVPLSELIGDETE